MTGRGVALAGTVEAPVQLAAPWGARGYYSDLYGRVHWIEFGAQTKGPPIVFVHGLGGSHLNWVLIGPQLAAQRRAVALDLRGFGLTPSRRRSASVQANLTLLHQFVTEIVGEPAILVGNSMGGMLSILAAERFPESVAGLVLIDPAVPAAGQRPDPGVAFQFVAYSIPGVGEAYLRALQRRATPREQVQGVIDLCFADPARADPAMVEATVALTELRQELSGRNAAFLEAARSLLRISGHARKYWETMAAIRVPVLLMGGTSDRLVPVASIRAVGRRNPGWQTEIFDGVGHTPQLETPGAVVTAVQGWLDQQLPPTQAQE